MEEGFLSFFLKREGKEGKGSGRRRKGEEEMALCSAAETTILPPIRILFPRTLFSSPFPKLPFFICFLCYFARKPPLKVVSELCARSRGMHESPDPTPRLAARSKKRRPAWSSRSMPTLNIRQRSLEQGRLGSYILDSTFRARARPFCLACLARRPSGHLTCNQRRVPSPRPCASPAS